MAKLERIFGFRRWLSKRLRQPDDPGGKLRWWCLVIIGLGLAVVGSSLAVVRVAPADVAWGVFCGGCGIAVTAWAVGFVSLIVEAIRAKH